MSETILSLYKTVYEISTSSGQYLVDNYIVVTAILLLITVFGISCHRAFSKYFDSEDIGIYVSILIMAIGSPLIVTLVVFVGLLVVIHAVPVTVVASIPYGIKYLLERKKRVELARARIV